MHASVEAFVEKTITSEYVTGKTVVEVGARDINGSVRPYIESLDPACYVGIDAHPGEGVDVLYDCEHLSELHLRRVRPEGVDDLLWDFVISVEMLEHTKDWRVCMEQIAGLVAQGGWLLVAVRVPEDDVVLAHDHWAFTETDMVRIMDELGFSSPLFVDRYRGDGADGVIVLGKKSVELEAHHLGGINVAVAAGNPQAVGGCRWVLSATAEKVFEEKPGE
jgi:hypothetical protein